MRPVIIAHRGASGHLPEHTLPAKALAYAMGADYLEQDVVATGDDELVVLHDVHLDRVTNVEDRFPDRSRADGRYYVRDFSLEEIKSLRVHHRRNPDGSPVYPARISSSEDDFRVITYVAFDPSESRFRSWFFDSRGGFGGGAWTHIEQGYSVASVIVLPDGHMGSSLMTWEMVYAYTATWSAMVREVGG